MTVAPEMAALGLDLPLWMYPALFLVALAAGTMDTIAGGGGLITLPVLMGFGWSPQMALGTNKFQSSFGSGSATYHFARAGAIAWRGCLAGVLFTAAGTALGTYLVGNLSSDFLRRVIPLLLLAMALYFLLSPRLGETEGRARMGHFAFHLLFGLGLGFYDGFFGPGTGSFWAAGYMLLLGFEMKRATAHTKLMNFTSNLVSLGLFAAMGCVVLVPGLVMAVGQFLGGRIGTKLVLSRGARLVRPVFICVALALALKLLYDAFLR